MGWQREQIRHLLRTERLWRVHREVFALEGPLSAKGRAQAAVLRMGDRSMLAFLSAAVLASLRGAWPATPQVILAGEGSSRSPKGIHLRRSATLRRADVIHIDGIRTTSPRRTILDCATVLGTGALKSMLRQAEFHHRLDLATLDVPRAPKHLQALLALYVRGSGLTDSELEARFLEIVAAAGLPMPQVQRHLEAFRIDFVWPELGLIVETDGRDAHDRSLAFTDDRRRDRRLKIAGFDVLRFTWNEVAHDAATVARDLAAAIARR